MKGTTHFKTIHRSVFFASSLLVMTIAFANSAQAGVVVTTTPVGGIYIGGGSGYYGYGYRHGYYGTSYNRGYGRGGYHGTSYHRGYHGNTAHHHGNGRGTTVHNGNVHHHAR